MPKKVEKKKFHLGDVLSVTTGRLLSLTHMDGVYDILNFMTGDSLFTHQLPRASKECRPYLLKQYPKLSEVDVENVGKENWKSWLSEQVKKYGEFLEVKRIPARSHENIGPITELASMMGNKPMIVVKMN